MMELFAMFTNCNWCNIVLSLVVLLICLAIFLLRRPRNFPPGPPGLPLVGYIPFFGENAAETFQHMKDKYGPVMSVQVGRDDWVILNDFDIMNEALVKQAEKFSGRPSSFIFDLITKGKGVAGVDYGPEWKNLRKFGFHTLRGFGVGKKSMEQNIVEEIPLLIEMLTTDSGKTVNLKVTQAVSNILNRVTFGSRMDYDDKKFNRIIEISHKFFSDCPEAKTIAAMTMLPALRFFPPFKGAVENFVKDFNEMLGYFEEAIDEHKADFNENDIRDFIDAFLKEMKERGPDDNSFNREQLIQYIRDLIEAGTGTTSGTLCWAFVCFLNYPEHQEKIYQEVVNVIGDSGTPSMKYQDDMPYTCAFIQEIMRHRTLAPLGVLHKTTEDAVLNGYSIPKNTIIAPNVWAVHYDPEYFENPKEFRPERFIDKDGKFIKSDRMISFSMGPRRCIGEHLAKMELFLFLTGIVQKLKVVPDSRYPLPSFEKGFFNMLTYELADFHAVFEHR